MSKACKEDDCPGIAGGSGAGRGWCSKHYGRWRSHGDPRGAARQCDICESSFFGPAHRKFCSGDCQKAAAKCRLAVWHEQNPGYSKTYAADYYERNGDEVRRKSRIWREANAERHQATSRAYRERYPDRVREGKRLCYERKKAQYLARAKAYRDLNREASSIRAKRWQQANPDVVRAIKKRYKVKRRGWEDSGFRITQRALDRIMIRANNRCVYCSADLSGGYHWDHVVPLSRGGAHGEGNLAPSCPSCNLSKARSEERRVGQECPV